MDTIISEITEACQEIYNYISNHDISMEKSGDTNQSGDHVHIVDLVTNDIIKDRLSKLPDICAMASEEDEGIIHSCESGEYIVAFDPLDGSQNIDPGLEVGSIFGIFKKNSDDTLITDGNNLIAAVYVLYGSTLQMMIARDGRIIYRIYSHSGKLIKESCDYKPPTSHKFYCTNESNRFHQKQDIIDYFRNKAESGLSCRWGGCMVQDVHRIMIQGGTFAYPSDAKNKNGRLRLLYECYPMAYIIETAGGKAYTDTWERLLDVKFDENNLHQKISIIMEIAFLKKKLGQKNKFK